MDPTDPDPDPQHCMKVEVPQQHAKKYSKNADGWCKYGILWSKLPLHDYAQKWFTAAPHA
jgi:hypothetical protein